MYWSRAIYLSHLSSAGPGFLTAWISLSPRLCGNEAALNLLSLHLSAWTMTLYLSFCTQILSYQGKSGKGTGFAHINGNRAKWRLKQQLWWAKCQQLYIIYKASLWLLGRVQHVESGIHACFRCWLLTLQSCEFIAASCCAWRRKTERKKMLWISEVHLKEFVFLYLLTQSLPSSKWDHFWRVSWRKKSESWCYRWVDMLAVHANTKAIA